MKAIYRALFFLLLGTPSIISAQTLEIKGIVRDKNKIGIPYATVSIKNKTTGCIADEKGNYRLIVTSKDTLVISSPGYTSSMIDMKKTGILSPLFIYLLPKEVQTKTVENTVLFQKSITEGIYNLPSDATFTADYGQSVVVKINNPVKKEALLSKIHAQFAKRNPTQRKLRIRIFSVNPSNGEPFDDLLTENIIVTVASGHFSFDIEPYKIAVPSEGCFVGFDWVEMPEAGKKNTLSGITSSKTALMTPLLKTTSKVCNAKTYERIFASEWHSRMGQSGNCPSNALIAATLKY